MPNGNLAILLMMTISLLATSCTPRSETSSTPPPLLPQGGTEPPIEDGVKNSEKQKLQPLLNLGERAVAWLNLVNQNRNYETRLNLADRTTKNPVPPESPKVNSVKYLLNTFQERSAQMPEPMRAYLLEGKALVEIPPVSDEVFIKSIRGFNGAYQNAIRLIGQVSWFDYYAEQDVQDIRGYYFFMKDPAAEKDLLQFFKLETDLQTKYSEWLIGMCHNSSISKENCATELNQFVMRDQVAAFYSKYLGAAKATYDSYFQVRKIRQDLKWNTGRSSLTQDFILPSVDTISLWLKTNVEEEWKIPGFELLVNFVSKNRFSPFLVFEKGVTPHVSGTTWNTITMDPDYSLDDYDTQWTIRHEFGHVLGFKDCYLEFYDKDKEEMLYYTIEPDNLMCAWGGKLQPSHIEELKRVYQ